ncbi:general substrate transporter [Myriangium duriaei CBS 260.36]|uniref:General substrate transporter n=1 Tax=Myriangium duriaei CBS 260.36 TaxID=1168546 RepID=A0A9P4J2B2_9PEZI|nr:general substrate transporter [Myriangium duriaei CBS 260.36]
MAFFRDITVYFIVLLLVATIGPFLFGYHLAELNGPKAVLTCEKRSEQAGSASLPTCIPMNSAQLGLVSSIFTLGGLIGALAAGSFSEKYGRYKTMLGTSLFHVLGPVLEALARGIPTMAVGRILSGVGAGSALVVVPIYISELSPPHQKGFFGAFTQVTTNVGILTTQVLGLFFSKGQYWRIILAAAGIFGLAQIAGLVLFGQESPKWLADHDYPIEAKRILRKVRGHKADIDAEVRGWGVSDRDTADHEESTLLHNEERETDEQSDDRPVGAVQKSRDAVKAVSHEVLGFFAILKDAENRPAVLVVMVVMLGQQLTGINSVIMYGVDVLSGLLAANSALLNVGVALLNVIVTAGSAPLIDRFGRKTCLLVSVSIMGISSLFIGVGISKQISIMSGVAVLTFVAGFAIGIGPIPFILSSELVNAEAVGSTQSWALAANWISTFLVAQFFPIINEQLGGGKVYFGFTLVAVLFAIFLITYLPESKGKATADEVWGRKRQSSERED